MFHKNNKQNELHKNDTKKDNTVNNTNKDDTTKNRAPNKLDIYRDVYSNLCNDHDKHEPFIDEPKMNKEQIVIEAPTKYLPNVECVLKYDKDKHSFSISDVLPLLQLVQDEANQNIYVDDVKASEVANLIKTVFHDSVKISYPQINDPWTTFPRDITIQDKDDIPYSTHKDYPQIAGNVESFVNGIQDILKDIKKDKNKYLVIRKVSKVNLKNEMSN